MDAPERLAGPLKLVEDLRKRTSYLYDLKRDPGERAPRAWDPAGATGAMRTRAARSSASSMGRLDAS